MTTFFSLGYFPDKHNKKLNFLSKIICVRDCSKKPGATGRSEDLKRKARREAQRPNKIKKLIFVTLRVLLTYNYVEELCTIKIQEEDR